METQIITTEYLHKIENALNLPSHPDFSPQIRLSAILQTIQGLSQRANHDFVQQKRLLNDLQDYMEVIEIDFSKFVDDPQAYEDGWKKFQEDFVRRPR